MSPLDKTLTPGYYRGTGVCPLPGYHSIQKKGNVRRKAKAYAYFPNTSQETNLIVNIKGDG